MENDELGANLKPAVCIVVSSPKTVEAFLLPHIRALEEHFTVHLVGDFGVRENFSESLRANSLSIRIVRKPSPFLDISSFIRLIAFMKATNIEIVISMTPKAGLLAMTAARFVGVPRRIHWFTGQVWATRKGFSRFVLKAFDTFVKRMSSQVLVDSTSQRDFLVQEGVLAGNQGVVLGAGSVAGVDLVRFCPDDTVRNKVRSELGVKDDTVVLLYLGRLNRDKGILDLVEALRGLESDRSLQPIFVGDDEEDLFSLVSRELAGTSLMPVLCQATEEPERFLAAADFLCLPSHREGFGSVILEAAASGIPAVCSRIYGLSDAIVEGLTGLFFERGSAVELRAGIKEIIEDDELRFELGKNARKRVEMHFSQESLVRDFMKYILNDSAVEA